MVAAAIHIIFAQLDADPLRDQVDTIALMLGRRLPEPDQCHVGGARLEFADCRVAQWKTSPSIKLAPAAQ